MSVSGTMAILLFLFFTSMLSISYCSPLPVNAYGSDILVRRQQTLEHCGTGNPVDDCWRCDPGWADNRQRLADCAIGFGRNAMGGKGGRTYVVTNPGDEDPANPAPGTLRHGLVQNEPLWIIFACNMTIRPKQELLVSSHKTVDGRGASVVVGEGGACFTVRNGSNVIIHGITIRGCRPAPKSSAKTSDLSDGDGISLFGARDVWVDRCTLESCADGLVDVIEASTSVTVSNCLLTKHNKAMLLGHNDAFEDDRAMRVTVAFNRFGPGLVQRMPRCRFGVFHVVNNDYVNWGKYAIGGSASPTILSRGNRFCAGKEKEVTKRDGDSPKSEWQKWSWISDGDLMFNGAFFTASGGSGPEVKAPSFAKPASLVAPMTASAGALSCSKGSVC